MIIKSIYNNLQMNIQLQAFKNLIQVIIKCQQQLQLIRQLLNQELAFDLKSTFYHLTNNSQRMNLFTIKRCISQNEDNTEVDDAVVQSMIKYYSHGQLHLTIEDWKSIMVSRQDHLLRKLALQRQSMQKEPPQYILSYCRKIIQKEYYLHSRVIQNKYSSNTIKKVLSTKSKQGKIEECLQSLMPKQSSFQLQTFKQYLFKGEYQNKHIDITDLSYLFFPNNSKIITKFICKKQQQQKQNRLNNQVLVHRQFRKLDKKSNFNKTVLIRQAKSIENHIDRNHTHSSLKVRQKIEQYSCKLEKQLKVFFKSLDKMMKYNNLVITRKSDLITSTQTNFSLLFDQISTNKQIIPSQLQHYLRNNHITLPLSSIFILFKRYCDPITGKINKKHFKNIFKYQHCSTIHKANKVTQQFRRKTCLCLVYQIELQGKIEQIKTQLMNKVDLREVFDAIDNDNDRYFSQTDLKVMHKKIMNKDYKQNWLNQFWWRMNSIPSQMVDYDKFMYEMIPRIKQKWHKK